MFKFLKNNKKLNLIFLIIFLTAFVGLSIWRAVPSGAIVELKDEKLNVLVAKTPSERFRGLSNRENLGKYDGMIFLFPDSKKQGFVMRDMNFSLDIVWFSKGQVVDIAQNLEPEDVPESQLTVYYPRKDADMVLELPAGWAREHHLKIGDSLEVVR